MAFEGTSKGVERKSGLGSDSIFWRIYLAFFFWSTTSFRPFGKFWEWIEKSWNCPTLYFLIFHARTHLLLSV